MKRAGLVIAASVGTLLAMGQPSPVSPGDAAGRATVATVAGGTPAFSWSAVDGARRYELAVYAIDESREADELARAQAYVVRTTREFKERRGQVEESRRALVQYRIQFAEVATTSEDGCREPKASDSKTGSPGCVESGL